MKPRLFSLMFAVTTAAMIGLGASSACAGGHHLANRCNDCGVCGGRECHACRHGCRACGGHGCGACGSRNWNGEWAGSYYHTMWGQPVALVVPPTAELQTHWNWGVAQTRVTPICPQFSRAFPGPYSGGRGFSPTPRWPSSTDQFGVYYVRGPW
jgi:hypothetical protein